MNGLKNNTSVQEGVRKRRGHFVLSQSRKMSAVHFEFDLVTEYVLDSTYTNM